MRQEQGLLFFFLAIFGPAQVYGYVYLLNMRGSNNRLNEEYAVRDNDYRLFNSQNNRRGGFNVGDKQESSAGSNQNNQYPMTYFQSGPWKDLADDKGKTFLTLEWTALHGCGANNENNPQKQNCAVKLQYMCQDDEEDNAGSLDSIRNGGLSDPQDYKEPTDGNVNDKTRKSKDVHMDRGQHETWDYYNKCYLRERNHGLFSGHDGIPTNNKLGFSSAVYTRMNPDGDRYGYECPEEQTYHPYWHPNPWVDVAILAENASRCSYYTSNSNNVRPYGLCAEKNKNWSRWNNAEDCTKNGGTWYDSYNYLEKATDKTNQRSCEETKTAGLTYKWAIPYDSASPKAECLVMADAPACTEASWSRSNHLGNGRDGVPLNFTWTLPYFPSEKPKRCVFRIRYNITSDDYDPYNTDYRNNGDNAPITFYPSVKVMNQESLLSLSIDVKRFGRVFQDRSHMFKLRPRPANLKEARIFNLNVRGKRGNIVQNFPAVEYDFTPNRLQMTTDDYVHIQWTGSNTHRNRGGRGGDGQTGADGEGLKGTDRNNIVELMDRSGNFPTPFEQTKLWNNVEIAWIYHGKMDISPKDLAINLASSGFFRCSSNRTCPEEDFKPYLAYGGTKTMNNRLDNAPASYEGVVIRVKAPGVYHYMCTRNNNFSNRSQKGAIVITKK